MTIISWIGYFMIIVGDLPSNSDNNKQVGDYCKENFTYDRCYVLGILNSVIYFICSGVNIIGCAFHASVWSMSERSIFDNLIYELDKLDKSDKFKIFRTICKYSVIVILILFPAIVSRWLLSANSITTKLVFGICSISLSRLVEHFNDDEPEKANTIISRYLNKRRWKVKEPIEEIKIL